MSHLPLQHPRLLWSGLDQVVEICKKTWPNQMVVVPRATVVGTGPAEPKLMFDQQDLAILAEFMKFVQSIGST